MSDDRLNEAVAKALDAWRNDALTNPDDYEEWEEADDYGIASAPQLIERLADEGVALELTR